MITQLLIIQSRQCPALPRRPLRGIKTSFGHRAGATAVGSVKRPSPARQRQDAPIVFSNGSMGSGSFVSDIDAFGCLRSLRAPVALDGVSWVQSGSVEIAIGQVGRMLQNRRRHPLPPWGIAPLGSSVGPPPADAA